MAVATTTCAVAGVAPQRGDVAFQTSFETTEERAAWSTAGFATYVPGRDGTTALRVRVAPEDAKGGHMVALPLDVAPYRGCKLLFECMAKAEGATKPPAEYLGVKFMLHYESESSGPLWKNENDVHGTFDWRKLQFSVRVAPDAKNASLSLGLQDSSGSAWFDDLRVTVLQGPVVRPLPPANPPPAYRGHDLPRLRGVMSPTTFRDEDLRVLGQEWKANLIRWQLVRNWGKSGTDRDLAEYDRWIGGKLDELDRVLEAAGRYGVNVVIDIHSPPGGRHANNDLAMLHEPEYLAHWISVWERIALRYKGNKAVWAYDLINEPVLAIPAEGKPDEIEAQVQCARSIRVIDADVPILIAGKDWSSPDGFREVMPVDVPNVVYQVHMYVPGQFTHQGVNRDWQPVTYPGKCDGVEWNKERLRGVLQPVREFQLAHNVHIYVGEFSAVRWAPGAVAYLRDCIELFEEYGWDWSYHAYREWDGWSVEHGADPDDHKPVIEPTDRRQLLLEWFGRNRVPLLSD
jgi:hypothetical protein